MTAVVFEHVPVTELLENWPAELAQTDGALVNVRIKGEARPAPTVAADAFVTDGPAFGIWRDRENVVDVAAYLRGIR